jgi:hypothetical protein
MRVHLDSADSLCRPIVKIRDWWRPRTSTWQRQDFSPASLLDSALNRPGLTGIDRGPRHKLVGTFASR